MEKVKRILPRNICIVDTETQGGLDKRNIYDLGYVFATYDDELKEYVPFRKISRIISQVYDNVELFETAYYGEKRPIYTNKLKGRKTKKQQRGHAFRSFYNKLDKYDTCYTGAFNMDFDAGAFKMVSERYSVINPLEAQNLFCIWELATQTICLTKEYIEFCEKYNFITDSELNYTTNAEVVYAFITNNPDFKEEHTGLEDALIELKILNYIVKNFNIDITKRYKKLRTATQKIKTQTLYLRDIESKKVFKTIEINEYSRRKKPKTDNEYIVNCKEDWYYDDNE